MYLSKSKYRLGLQCPKMLWMQKNMPEQYDDSVMNDAILRMGDEVGDLAMGYYGPFVEVEFDLNDPHRFTKAAERTQELLAEGCRTICEATFCIDDNYCMVDILRVRDDGSFDLVEVKSSAELESIHLDDIAYQCWVVQQCGFEVKSASLMHLNKTYVRSGELDLQHLFTVEDCSDEALSMATDVPSHVERILKVADSELEPDTQIGEHCFKPFKCGFQKWCFRGLPAHSVLELANIRKPKAFRMLERGLISFDDLANDVDVFDSLSSKQQIQVLAEVDGASPYIDVAKIRAFLDGLSYPLYFLDFETFQEAIPGFDMQRPYEQVTSQYSLHWVDRPHGELHHTEFLGEAGTDPRRQVAEHLCEDIPADACVLAWYMHFERSRIAEMAALFPDLSAHLLAIRDNVQDLMVPFSHGDYYMREMGGSASIKKVLPALFPDDPSLDYHALEGVHNGGEAAAAFQHLHELSPEEQAVKREQLLRYCELDTLAMVRIWEKLVEVVESV